MKQLLLTAALLSCYFASLAQENAVGVDLFRLTEAPSSTNLMFARKSNNSSKVMFGLRVGAATANIAADEVTFENAGRQFKLVADNKEFSYHLGVFAQFRMNKWALQPEVVFRSAKADYMLSEFVTTEFISSIRTENYAYVDVPVMLAYRLGALRIQAGPAAKFYITSSTEFVGIAEFSESYQKVDFGYQAGIGLDIWRFIVDLKYDGDIEKVGDHMSFGGQSIDFGTQAGRFLFSIGYSLVKP